MSTMVPTEVLRRAFADSRLTPGEVARRMGWLRPDSQRVRRYLGLSPQWYQGSPYQARTTSYHTAVELVRAMGLDPVDYGL